MIEVDLLQETLMAATDHLGSQFQTGDASHFHGMDFAQERTARRAIEAGQYADQSGAFEHHDEASQWHDQAADVLEDHPAAQHHLAEHYRHRTLAQSYR